MTASTPEIGMQNLTKLEARLRSCKSLSGRGVKVNISAVALGAGVDRQLLYGITCHKSQGSQFERVIIPVKRSGLLESTLLLTAVSRGQKQVVVIGARSVFNDAITSRPVSNQRQVGLWHELTLMKEMI